MGKNNTRLKLNTAKALVSRELGVSANRLTAETAGEGVYIYKMKLGRFEITVENDWYTGNGRLCLTVSSNTGEGMCLFYEPGTLEEDLEEGNRYRLAVNEERCAECPRRLN